MIPQILGGIGLFLVGMILMTDGLKEAAGDHLRVLLLRFTGGPLKAVVSGALVTAVVQSSSAVTVAIIGFVGAGLLSFRQALGVIFGANLGTTATSWIVAGIGLKLDVTIIALPLIGVGAAIRLMARRRGKPIGMALAGFGIIFVGIDVLQGGMQGLASTLNVDAMPIAGIAGILVLVGIGALMTAIMQSSSAAMATTLTALASGTLTLEQGAAMVIGVNIGTTITAGIAALGGSVAARRTALAHVLFNVVTGIIALGLLPIFTRVAARLESDPAILLAAFHSIFNLLGVIALLPLSNRFAEIVMRLVPERGPSLLRHLDPRAAEAGNIAIEGVRLTTIEIAGEAVSVLREVLRRGISSEHSERLERAAEALSATREYVSDLRGLTHMTEGERDRHLSTVHALDYVGRLVANVVAAESRYLASATTLQKARARLERSLEAIHTWIADPAHPAPVELSREATQAIADERKTQRETLLRSVARGDTGAGEADRLLVAMRWIDECAFYAYRVTEYLRGERAMPDGKTTDAGSLGSV